MQSKKSYLFLISHIRHRKYLTCCFSDMRKKVGRDVSLFRRRQIYYRLSPSWKVIPFNIIRLNRLLYDFLNQSKGFLAQNWHSMIPYADSFLKKNNSFSDVMLPHQLHIEGECMTCLPYMPEKPAGGGRWEAGGGRWETTIPFVLSSRQAQAFFWMWPK